MEPRNPDAKPRFRLAVQPAIVKIYKAVGVIALTSILIGLLSFLIVNIFYFFDHTWVRPVVLSPTHKSVIEASTQLADAKLHASQFLTEKIEIEADLAESERVIASADKYIADTAPLVAATPMKSTDAALLRRQIDQVTLDKQRAEGRRATLKERMSHMATRIKEQDQLVNRLASSPYLRAVDRKLVIAFVPYQNLKNVKVGTPLYGCSWGLVLCSRVGKITGVVDGEVTDMHPHDESAQRGLMVEVELTKPSAEEDRVLFAGGKPLWLF
ncbi:MAG TPA: hypothetical protein PLF40_01350 [Kofleriaceae bacterium]|nr:hypothetical protein [Kofleriaceae bacterium]